MQITYLSTYRHDTICIKRPVKGFFKAYLEQALSLNRIKTLQFIRSHPDLATSLFMNIPTGGRRR